MSNFRIDKPQATMFIKNNDNSNLQWLVELLKKDKDRPYLTKSEFDALEEWQKELLNNDFNDILKRYVSSWKVDSNYFEIENEKQIYCDLCGTTIQKEYRIYNIDNPKDTMIVGSSCIDLYPYMTDNYGRTTQEIRKKKCETDNKIRIAKEIPSMLNNIDKFNKTQIDKQFLTRKDLSNRYNELKEIMVNKFQKYIKLKKISQEKMNELKKYNHDIELFLNSYKEYIKFCKKDVFGFNEKITNWIKKNCDFNLTEKLKKAGKITIETIGQIKEPSFMKEMIKKLKKLFQQNNIHVEYDNVGIKFSACTSDSNIFFENDSNEFIKDYMSCIFNGNNNVEINKEKLINNASIVKSSSIDKAVKGINNYLNKTELKYEYSDLSFDEIAYYDKKEKKYYILYLKKFIEKFTISILSNKIKNNIDEIIKYIKNNSEIERYEDFKEHKKLIGIIN